MTRNQTYLVVVAIAAATLYLLLPERQQPDLAPNSIQPSDANPRHTSRGEAIVERPQQRTGNYVGSDACRDCHEEINRSFARHPMANSMHLAIDSDIEDYTESPDFRLPPAPHSKTYYEYSVHREGGSVRHQETMRDKKNDEAVYELDTPMHFAVGSGHRGRSYINFHNGVMRMSPLTWYTSGNKWDLSPGYERRNLQFQRRIVDGCLQCHAGRVTPRPDNSTHQFAEKPFAELCIGCERCHGPGKDHIAYHNGLEDQLDDSIVNPNKLSDNLSDHVCFQCHLIGEERITQYGRTDFDFRPGDRISDIWTIFIKGASIDEEHETEAVSQVGQMLSSRCYTQSEGKLGCISCHDPHSAPTTATRADFYRNRCMACHAPEMQECTETLEARRNKEDSCMECHMPKLNASDVPHISLTDHRVLRRPGAAAPAKTQLTETIFIDNDTVSPKAIARAKAIRMVSTAGKSGESMVAVQAIPTLEEWLKMAPDDLLALDALGSAYELVGESRSALNTWQEGLKYSQNDERFLRQLFFHSHDRGQLHDAARWGKRLIDVNSSDYEYHGRMAHVLGQLQMHSKGIQHAKRALEINPSSFQLHGWLADVLLYTGQVDAAEKHRRLYELMSR